MRVFVTGATGFVGSAVVQELLKGGHEVLGLTRSDAGAASLTAAGASMHYGSLQDLDSLHSGAAKADGVIHTAFIHDFSKFTENCEIDRVAIGALGEALVGTGKPLIVTSGTALISPGTLATEDMRVSDARIVPRVSEQAADLAGAGGARALVVRLPPSVHGEGDHGFVPLLIGIAREKGVSAYIGDGQNRWPAVHRLDAARVYRLVLEQGVAGGRYHAVADQGVPFKDIATVIGKHLNLPVVSKSPAEAADHFGWFTHFAAIDAPASGDWTQATLGWSPVMTSLIPDLDKGHYF